MRVLRLIVQYLLPVAVPEFQHCLAGGQLPFYLSSKQSSAADSFQVFLYLCPSGLESPLSDTLLDPPRTDLSVAFTHHPI